MYNCQQNYFIMSMNGGGPPEGAAPSRVRSVTQDSGSFASSESSLCSGNRARSNTGDSLSSSDNSTSVPLGPDGKPLQGARRRSHRPRGCRGGRKNRKNKERLRSNTSKLPNDLHIPGDSAHHAALPSTEKAFERTLPQPPGFTAGDSYSPSKALMPPPANIRPRFDSKQSQFKPINESSLATTLSASSSMSSSSSHWGYSDLPTEILPPALSLDTASPLALPGPNPYALNTNGNMPTCHTKSNASPWSSLPAIATCVSLDEEVVVVNQTMPQTENSSVPIPPVSAECDPDSGSLFATSPRSFLMGEVATKSYW